MARKKCPRCKALKPNLQQCKKRHCKAGSSCYVHQRSVAQGARRRQLLQAYGGM